MAPIKVLIADDDEDILNLVKVALLAEKYEIVLARNGSEAVDRAREEQPNLILMDVEMPRMSGLEACRALRADPGLKSVPVIMLTSRSSEKDIMRGFQDGAHDYITKPFSLSHLRARVRIWLLRSGQVPEDAPPEE
ncbi:MAG: response regulator [Armatimonadetes bacterium]|nr:response regulator [Armatimonadota bacterium]